MPLNRKLLLLMVPTNCLFLKVIAEKFISVPEMLRFEIKSKTVIINFPYRFWPNEKLKSPGFKTFETASSFENNVKKIDQIFILKSLLGLRPFQRIITEHSDLQNEATQKINPSLKVKSRNQNKMLPIPRIG